MIYDSAMIDRIVASVLEQLQPPAPRADVRSSTPAKLAFATTSSPSNAASQGPTRTTIGVTQAVVTAAVLEQLQLQPRSELIFGPRTVLTPTAHDWLRQRKVEWKRGHAVSKEAAASVEAEISQWHWVVSTVTPTVRGFMDLMSRSFPTWKKHLLGTADEVVDVVGRMIATAEAERVLTIAASADLIALRTNRSSKVRAAAVHSSDQILKLEQEISPNLLVLDPAGKSLMEMRQIVRACSQLGRPRPPAWCQ